MGILNALNGSTSVANGGSTGYNSAHSVSSTMGTGAVANQASLEAMREANAFNAKEAQKQREWNKMMSDTAYQRTVADLKSAGLNPIIAYGNGATGYSGGASASSAMASFHTDQEGYTDSYGENSSWNHSESASNLAEGIKALGGALESAFSAMGIKDLATAINNMGDKKLPISAYGTKGASDQAPRTWKEFVKAFTNKPTVGNPYTYRNNKNKK